MNALANVIGALIGSAISQGADPEDIKSGAKDYFSGASQNSYSEDYTADRAAIVPKYNSVEEQKNTARDLLKQYGTTPAGLQAANKQLGQQGGQLNAKSGNIYYTIGGQEYLVGGKDYNQLKFYNGLAAGGKGSAVMKSINQAQKQVDDYVAQLADYRASLQSSAEEAARKAYINQQLAQKSLRNNMARHGLENSGYYQKNQQSLKRDYEKALDDIQSELSAGLAQAQEQEKDIRSRGAEAISDILEKNGLLSADTVEFAEKEFPIIKVNKVNSSNGVFGNKKVPEKTQSASEEVSAEEFAAALNSDIAGEYRKLYNYVDEGKNTQEKIANAAELLKAGLPQNILLSILQGILAKGRAND